MSQSSILEQAARDLERLRTMPETPMRRREIIALQRLIESGAQQPEPEKKVRTPRKKAVKSSQDDEYEAEKDEIPSGPERVVENNGTHRQILIKKKKQTTDAEKKEEQELIKERKQRISNIKNSLGLSYRGFS